MCTLIAMHRSAAAAPLVVAANRDEFHARPAEGPALRATEAGLAVMPLDRQGGGTWLGLNGHGVFAAVTNCRCADPDPGRRSRGLLVLDALRCASAAEAVERTETLERDAYNPFNLFVADRERAFAVTYDGAPRRLELGPGVHVIGNTAPDAGSAKIERLAKRAERAAAAGSEGVLDALAAVCRGHEGGASPLEDACVHAGDYGTRSSTLLRLADRSGESRLYFAEGPPCRSEYEDFTPLLRELDRGSAPARGSASRGA